MGGSAVGPASSIVAIVWDDHPIIGYALQQQCATAVPPISMLVAKSRGDLWAGPGATADVVVLDLDIQDHGIQIPELVKLVEKGRQVVVYSSFTESKMITTCLHLRAAAYVAKTEGPEHLIAAIHAAAEGKTYTTLSVGKAILEDDDPAKPKLTAREIEIIQTWFTSRSKEVAGVRLFISKATVNETIARVRRKYEDCGREANTQAQLLMRMLEDGIRPPFDDDDGSDSFGKK